MRISDWSSDVCSSDLVIWLASLLTTRPIAPCAEWAHRKITVRSKRGSPMVGIATRSWPSRYPSPTFFMVMVPDMGVRRPAGDRKSVVKGKSVAVRVDIGGRCIIQEKKQLNTEE